MKLYTAHFYKGLCWVIISLWCTVTHRTLTLGFSVTSTWNKVGKSFYNPIWKKLPVDSCNNQLLCKSLFLMRWCTLAQRRLIPGVDDDKRRPEGTRLAERQLGTRPRRTWRKFSKTKWQVEDGKTVGGTESSWSFTVRNKENDLSTELRVYIYWQHHRSTLLQEHLDLKNSLVLNHHTDKTEIWLMINIESRTRPVFDTFKEIKIQRLRV